eukprot:2725924-Rhodomonas_salina.2
MLTRKPNSSNPEPEQQEERNCSFLGFRGEVHGWYPGTLVQSELCHDYQGKQRKGWCNIRNPVGRSLMAVRTPTTDVIVIPLRRYQKTWYLYHDTKNDTTVSCY